jgi:hypothetical protein
MRGKTVCRLHGGKGGARKAPRTNANTVTRPAIEASLAERAQRRADKAAGLPVRRMGRPKGARWGETNAISRARAALTDETKGLPAVPPDGANGVPFERMQDADQLYYLSRRGRQSMLDIFNLPNKLVDFADARDPHHAHNQRLRLQSDLAQNLLHAQIKVDETSLHHVEHTDKIDILMQKLRAVKMPTS